MAVVLTIRGVGIITSIHNVDALHILMAYMGIIGCSVVPVQVMCVAIPQLDSGVRCIHTVYCVQVQQSGQSD